jgi:hypothetical protein
MKPVVDLNPSLVEKRGFKFALYRIEAKYRWAPELAVWIAASETRITCIKQRKQLLPFLHLTHMHFKS